eukprot:9502114-Pyramimonas_sp.AAC.1
MQGIVDIEKCFDRVPWRVVALAGKRHGFPGWLLGLALKMYRASSRLSWDSVFFYCGFRWPWCSPRAWNGNAHVAVGSPCAFGWPLRRHKHFIMRHVYVYADDLTIVITAPLSHIIEH